MGTAGGGVAAAARPPWLTGPAELAAGAVIGGTRQGCRSVAAPLEGLAHGKAVCALPVRPSLL